MFKKLLKENTKLDLLIKDLVEKHSDGIGSNEGRIEAIECESRAGFIASSHNCGGYDYTTFDYVSAGNAYSSKEATARLNETLNNAFTVAIKELGLPKDSTYQDLTPEQQDKLSEIEQEYLSDETFMLQIRVMYGGVDAKGKHIAYVSSVINWEAPYHRSSISWMPSMKCETAKEVTVTFKNLREAKTKINAALLKVKRIF
ncbi:MAG TPA: hypothetical protein P5523_04875 [Bacteroidales bacterium]|nr:hypothetical protein [Bacteroidales bacterium]